MSEPTFRLEGAAVAFEGHTALDGVDLEVAPGEALALVGPSGAGKTTLLRLMNGTVYPTRGRVRFEGTDLAQLERYELRALRALTGYVPQDHALVPTLRVSQNVVTGKLGQRGFWAALRSILWTGSEDLERAHALLERVGIPEKLFQRTDQLSGGQQQRVAIARALFQEPRALLADEPVASVDPTRARDLLGLLLEIAAERGLTLVVSLHDLALARELFPRTAGLRAGVLHFDRPTDEIGEDEFTELYRLEDNGVDG
ncbi:MAG: phosphonate ABC transporter ATP-binding protein [bacterium]|nr:phosphonate ABC transporter ATP-binding protein [bacterium]